MKETLGLKGRVLVRLYDENQNLKYESEKHNIITEEGDAYIADLLSSTPTRTKLDGTNGYIAVGTGWTGTTPKSNTWVNTQAGTAKVMDATYPKLKGSWGNADDNVLVYKVTYTPGLLNVNGINEAALVNGLVNGASVDCIAYAQITPSVNVTVNDTLEIQWEITFLGS